MRGTQVFPEDRTRTPRVKIMSKDLGMVDRDQVIEIRTETGSRYRVMYGPNAKVGSVRITGVAVMTTNSRMEEDAHKAVQIDRMVRIGQQFYFGRNLRSHTSPVEAVYVGGRKVAG